MARHFRVFLAPCHVAYPGQCSNFTPYFLRVRTQYITKLIAHGDWHKSMKAWGFISCKDPTFKPRCPTLYHPTFGPSWALLRLPFWGRKATSRGPCGRQNFGHQCERTLAPLRNPSFAHTQRVSIARPSRSRVCTPDLYQRAFSSHSKAVFSPVYLVLHRPVRPSFGQHIRVVYHLRLCTSTVLIHQNALRKDRAPEY